MEGKGVFKCIYTLYVVDTCQEWDVYTMFRPRESEILYSPWILFILHTATTLFTFLLSSFLGCIFFFFFTFSVWDYLLQGLWVVHKWQLCKNNFAIEQSFKNNQKICKSFKFKNAEDKYSEVDPSLESSQDKTNLPPEDTIFNQVHTALKNIYESLIQYELLLGIKSTFWQFTRGYL